VWCPGHLWAPSCYLLEKFYQKCFAISGAWVGSGGEVYIGAEGEGRRERRTLQKTGAMPVVMIDEKKGKMHKTGHITLYTKLFKGTGYTLKNDVSRKIKLYIPRENNRVC